MAARDHYPTRAINWVLDQYQALEEDEAEGRILIGAAAGDVSSTKLNQSSIYYRKTILWETLCAKDSDTYTWPPPFAKRTRTVAKFRQRTDQ